MKYHVSVDGQEKETFTYEITRKVGLWLGLVPFVWANLLTYSEDEAFEATTYRFVEDAQKYFTAPGI